MSCGVYKITNIINGKVYIGCSNDIEDRWYKHKYEASHSELIAYNYSIHQAFRKYGLENFKFEIIENCDDYFEREKYWIAFYDSYNNGYNETLGGDCGPSLPGEKNPRAKLTEEDVYTIRMCILNQEDVDTTYLKYADKISRRQFNRIIQGENWTNILQKEILDFRKTDDYKQYRQDLVNTKRNQKRAKIWQDIAKYKKEGKLWHEVYPLFKDYYTENGFKDFWYNLPKNEETYQYTRGRRVQQIDPNTLKIINIFNTIVEASQKTQCDGSSISKVCRGKKKQCGGYIWKYD